MASKRKSLRQLNIVFDTNVLHSQAAHYLLRSEVQDLIKQNSGHVDLSIRWLLPEVVINERRYQMQRRALDLLPNMEKLEALLGHKLGITPNILEQRVSEAITQQIGELGMEVLELDTSSVEWKEIIKSAVFRKPPFSAGEKEKGFRDSLIAETFIQLVDNSPITPSVCLLAIVTSDNLLVDYLKLRTQEARNVRILSNISELESLINTLTSTITEEFASELIDKAIKYFFEKDEQSTLYFKEKIREKILDLHGKELTATPAPEISRENGTWWISKPIFVKKEKQRVYWSTPITIDAKLFKFETTKVPMQTSSLLDPQKIALSETQKVLGKLWQSLHPPEVNKIEIGSGKTSFEVHWSVSVNQSKKLTAPNIEKIQFISTKWSES